MNVAWARGPRAGLLALARELLRDGTWHADYVRLRMRAVKV